MGYTSIFAACFVLISISTTAPAQTVAKPNAQQPDAGAFRQDVATFVEWVNLHYAYLDRLPGGRFSLTTPLTAEAARVHDRRSLVRFLERALLILGDNHAITRTSLDDSWAVIPSYSDLWVERQNGAYIITAVRENSPAAAQKLLPGMTLTAINDVPTARAVAQFWADLGVSTITDAQAGYAARTLAAGKRRQARSLSIGDKKQTRTVALASLYSLENSQQKPLDVIQRNGSTHIIFNDSLGEQDTIAAFDTAMTAIPNDAPVTLDFTNTPGGGNSSVARGIMGWFIDKPSPYQIHDSPREFRHTGVDRRWIEYVMPRKGKHHQGAVRVRVGRWTGSMGEGLAIGLNALGAQVYGDPMAGLIGAVEDFELPNSKIGFKLPIERLFAVDGTPREDFKPRAN